MLKQILLEKGLMISIMVQNFFKKSKICWNEVRRSKKLYDVFKSNINEMSRERYKWEEQICA